MSRKVKRTRSQSRQNGQGIEKSTSSFYMLVLFILKAALGTAIIYLIYMNTNLNSATASTYEQMNIYIEVYINILIASLASATIIILIFYGLNANVEYEKAVKWYFSPRAILHNVIEALITAGIYIWLDNYYTFMYETMRVAEFQIYLYYFIAKLVIKIFVNVFSRALSTNSSQYVKKHSSTAPYFIAILIIMVVFLFRIIYVNLFMGPIVL